MRKQIMVLVVAVTAALVALVPAGIAKSGDVKQAGTCTALSKSTLKVGLRNAKIKASFEVEHAVAGNVWNVTLTDNGTPFFQGQATPAGVQAQFEVEKKTANRVGPDLIAASATDTVTGETCTASLSV